MASESDLVPDADPDATSAMEPVDIDATDDATEGDAGGGRLSSFLRSDPVLLESTAAGGVPGLGPAPGLDAPDAVAPTRSRTDQARKDQGRATRKGKKKPQQVVADPVGNTMVDDDEFVVPQHNDEFVVPQNPQMETAGGVAEVAVASGTPRPTVRDRRAAGKLRARKVRRLIRHFEPWSVLKISLLFFFCLWAIFMLAGYGLWYFANEAEVLDNVENFIEQLFVLEEFAFNWDQIFRACALGGLVLTVAATGFMVLMAVLFNLISDLTGGIRVTVIEEETARVWPSRRAQRQTEVA